MWKSIGRAVVCAAGVAGAANTAEAASVSYFGSSGSLSASAKFELVGSTLTVSLTNTAGSAAPDNSGLLTGVFWNSSDAIGGTLTSLDLGGVGTGPGGLGSVITAYNGGSAEGVGLYGYGTNSSGPGGRDYGAFSSGYATTSSELLGPGGSTPPNSPDGPGGGLAPNAGFTGANGVSVVRNTVVYTISNVGGGFGLNDIEDVWFQYGTSLSQPGYVGIVPLPAAAWMGIALFGSVGGAGFIRRRRQMA